MIIRLWVEATTLGVGSGGKLRPGNGGRKDMFWAAQGAIDP